MDKKLTIPHVFDINGTLIRDDNNQSLAIQNYLRLLKAIGHEIWITSGDEVNDMKITIERLGLSEYVTKYVYKPDLIDQVMRNKLDIFLYDNDPMLSIIFKKFIQF